VTKKDRLYKKIKKLAEDKDLPTVARIVLSAAPLSARVTALEMDRSLMKLLRTAISIYPEYRESRSKNTIKLMYKTDGDVDEVDRIAHIETQLKKKGWPASVTIGCFVYNLFEGVLKLEKNKAAL